jgi:hypothetical protein
MTLADLKRLALAATPGPYYVALDDAEECGPHRNSGLSLVDTGRQEDWPIARLCETASARYIAALSPERVLALLAVIEAAKAMRRAGLANLGDYDHAFDAALAKLETANPTR